MIEENYSIELPRDKAELFKKYLRDQGIEFEPSEAQNLIHIECLMTLDEFYVAAAWVERNL